MLASVEAAAAESLSEDALVHLKSYKYSSVDESYISNYILKHYWNACVEFLPMWLAPNMVTLLGFFCIISNVIFLVIWQPEMNGQDPSWIYYSFAFGLWAYSTMDNIDGKQARRTGTSSPLGELFDHGIDSLNCTLASLLETAAMGLGNSKAAMFTALVPCLPMFFSTWETYHTHTLYLGVINGPTEGLIIACMVMALAGHFGPVIWTQPLTDFFGTAFFPSSLAAITFRDVWVGLIVLTLFGTQIPFCVLNVVRARRRDGLPVAPVFLEWTPMIVFTLAIGAWLLSPHSTLMAENHLVLFCLTMAFVFGRMTTKIILAHIGAWLLSPHSTLMAENHLVLFCLTMAFVFGRMTTKIILAHLTRQPFPYWTVMLWPLVGGAMIFNFPVLGLPPLTAGMELLYLRAYFVFAAVVYFRWAFLVINSICSYLGINCLTIPDAKNVANSREAEIERKLAETSKIQASVAANGSASRMRSGSASLRGKGGYVADVADARGKVY
ncbi:hypothetical protein V495_07499 [Pseudogymnoascus sp. VKM F-4514 (FW-929)]|nr:hypothetical protein V495_07499 [Pseudogymnoascus sp. VKM F-4514 (FW-929)]